MSRSDFDRYDGKNTSALEGPSSDGSAVLHAPLSNPLTGHGNFCRKLRQVSNGSAGTTIFSIGSGVSSGAFIDVDNSKAISLRYWARSRSEDDVQCGNAMGVANRYYHTTSNANPIENWVGTGMRFGSVLIHGTGRNANNLLRVALWSKANENSNDNTGNTETVFVTNPLTASPWLHDTWYRLRYDFIPTGTLAYEQRAYIFTSGDEEVDANWTLIGNKITSSLNADYVPIGSGQRVGFYYANTCYRDYVGEHYIDAFDARISNIP